MNISENINELAEALSICQSTLRDVFKGTKGYGYNYAPLDKVYDEVRPKMTECGLSLTHQKSFNREASMIELRSMLIHKSGQWIQYYGSLPFAPMKGMNDYQATGSGFTYLERYQTSAIFGITADEDNDAQGEQTKPKATATFKTHSNSTDAEKVTYKKQFGTLCEAQELPIAGVNEFLNFCKDGLGTPGAEKNNAIVQFLRSPDLLATQIGSYMKSKGY